MSQAQNLRVSLRQHPQGNWSATATYKGKTAYSAVSSSPVAAARILYRRVLRAKIDPKDLEKFAGFMGVSKDLLDTVDQVFDSVSLDRLHAEAEVEKRKQRKKLVSKKARERRKRIKQMEKEVANSRQNSAIHS